MSDSPEQQFPTCPYCGLPGGAAMIPAQPAPGDTMPRVRRGIRWECGTTEDVQSRMCANIVERVESERAAIVAWMREPVEWTTDPKPYAEERGIPLEDIEWAMRRTLDTTADDIENGAHHA